MFKQCRINEENYRRGSQMSKLIYRTPLWKQGVSTLSTGKFVATCVHALPGVGEMETAANCLIAAMMCRVIRMPSFNTFTVHLR